VRGPILDRNGEPLAVSKVSYYPALKFKQFESDVTREEIIEWGRVRIKKANEIFGTKWDPSDNVLWEHYRFRRWMAMPYTFFVVNDPLRLKVKDQLLEGLVMHPIYQRLYPQGKSAAHIIGYTGIKGKLEVGAINYGDPIFPYTEGKAGLESLFDAQLRGERGLTRTEKVLKEKTNKGAIVIIDVQTGEVLTMASQPSFDPNLFVPRVLSKHFDPLIKDKNKPLYARAFQGAYPPASAFKPIVALAALKAGRIERGTKLHCPAYFEYNNHKFWDWSKSERGDISVVTALIQSNNPFFYQLGREMKSSYFVDFARKFGFGQKTGLPLLGESAGNMPDDTWMLKYHRRRMHTGDHYNNAIGQGVLLATPLQVAQAMAALANGEYLPKIQLVRQVQDAKGKVIAANKPESKSPLDISYADISTVKEGMMKAVNLDWGTGKSGKLSFATMCGKTGTGQWKPANDQYVAWFAGFFPLKEPKYAFAVLYEGDAGEEGVSGGKKAAPLVKAFFEPLKDEIREALSPPARAVIVVEDATDDSLTPTPVQDGDIPQALVVGGGEEIIPKAVVEGEDKEEDIPKAVVEDSSEDISSENGDSESPQEEEIPKALPATE